jgi:hypothetical protein
MKYQPGLFDGVLAKTSLDLEQPSQLKIVKCRSCTNGLRRALALRSTEDSPASYSAIKLLVHLKAFRST